MTKNHPIHPQWDKAGQVVDSVIVLDEAGTDAPPRCVWFVDDARHPLSFRSGDSSSSPNLEAKHYFVLSLRGDRMVAISLGLDFTDATADEIVTGIRHALQKKARRLGWQGQDLDEAVGVVKDAVRRLDSQRKEDTADEDESDDSELIWVSVPRSEPGITLALPSAESLRYREPSAYLIEDIEPDE